MMSCCSRRAMLERRRHSAPSKRRPLGGRLQRVTARTSSWIRPANRILWIKGIWWIVWAQLWWSKYLPKRAPFDWKMAPFCSREGIGTRSKTILNDFNGCNNFWNFEIVPLFPIARHAGSTWNFGNLRTPRALSFRALFGFLLGSFWVPFGFAWRDATDCAQSSALRIWHPAETRRWLILGSIKPNCFE